MKVKLPCGWRYGKVKKADEILFDLFTELVNRHRDKKESKPSNEKSNSTFSPPEVDNSEV